MKQGRARKLIKAVDAEPLAQGSEVGEGDEPSTEVLESADDVALRPGPNADAPEDVEKYISQQVRSLYDVFSYRHAAAILATTFRNELTEIIGTLCSFRITTQEIGMPGGNESEIPKKFSTVLRPLGWVETRIQGDLVVRTQQLGSAKASVMQTDRRIDNFIDGHKIDYVKGRVAFDLEWNSKDQTFDRDLYALRAFHECGLISAGVLVTRSRSLNPVFEQIPQLNKRGAVEKPSVKAKFGASTTWMGKLLYRLNAGRHGGCPVLVFGITPKLISNWNSQT